MTAEEWQSVKARMSELDRPPAALKERVLAAIEAFGFEKLPHPFVYGAAWGGVSLEWDPPAADADVIFTETAVEYFFDALKGDDGPEGSVSWAEVGTVLAMVRDWEP